MSTVKISELPVIPRLNPDTTQTLVAGVDLVTGVTGKMTTKVLAQSLYSNDVLNVGNNAVILPNVAAQFAGSSDNYLQVNLQNDRGNGSADMVITADIGTDEAYYIDMGINGSTYNYDGYTYANPLDGYLVVQGLDENSPGGNLVIGTTTVGKNINFVNGSIDQAQIVMDFVYEEGLHMRHNPLWFADGSSQNTSSAPFALTNSIFGLTNSAFSSSNTVGLYANSAYIKANNVGNYANAAYTLANTHSESLTSINLTMLNVQNYANGAFVEANSASSFANVAFTKANNALANTTGTFGGSLTIDGKANVNQQLHIANSTYDYTNTALVRITGSTGAFFQPPAAPGYMLAITGVDGIPSRVVNTTYGTGTYALYVGRKANGTAASPTAVLSGDVIARFSCGGYTGSGFSNTGQGRIDFVATENYSTTNQGSKIEFYNTMDGSNTVNKIAAFNANSATFTGVVNPQKGFAYTPNVLTANATTYTIDFARDSMLKYTVNDNSTITLGNFQSGKIVELWITNNANQNKTITHGCLSNNSTSKTTTFTLQASACAFLKYFSIDGDQANTYVSITA